METDLAPAPLSADRQRLRLTDEVVELRPLAPADAPEHLAGRDWEWRRWLGPGPSGPGGTAAWLHDCEEQWRTGGPVFSFGVREVGAGALLGTVELQLDERTLSPGQACLRCGLYPPARGHGTAGRACRLASCFALRALARPPWNVAEVIAQIDALNAASLCMISRAGFVHAQSCVGAGEAWEVFSADSHVLPALTCGSHLCPVCRHRVGPAGLEPTTAAV